MMQTWPDNNVGLNPKRVIEMYDEGFSGVRFKQEDMDACLERIAQDGLVSAHDVVHEFGFAGDYAGQLVIPFVHVLEAYPGCWPGPAQDRGDCESHSCKNAALGSAVAEVVSGTPDEITGKVERNPEVSAKGIKNGVFSTESIYWYRGHGGDGWNVFAGSNTLLQYGGAVVRQKYPDLGFDLTVYSGRNAGKWGRRKPPANVRDMTDNHLFRTATEVETFEESRDLMGRGFFQATDGGESFSTTRDVNGASERTRKGWSHAFARIGFDDRPETVSLYGGPLTLELNSWAAWNSGPRDIRDSASYVPDEQLQSWIAKGIVNSETGNIMIPKGAWWARYKDVSRRRVMAMSGLSGWERNALPDLNPGF